MLRGLACAGLLAGAGIGSLVIAGGWLQPAGALSFTIAVACVCATLVAVLVLAHRAAGSLILVLASPVALAAATWLLLFVVRPLELYVAPWHAARGLGQLGFESADLARTTAIGALGCVFWATGYVATLGRRSQVSALHIGTQPLRFSGRAAAATLLAGTTLWLLLFLRQGGPSALAQSAVSIREGQNASFYGFFGVWLVQGTTLFAFAAWLRQHTRATLLTLFAGVPLSVLASLALQLRALAVFGALAAVVVYVRSRELRRSQLAIATALACIGFLVLGFLQQAREYTHRVPTGEAVRLTTETPLWAMYVSDFSTFDSFVAVESLVPESIDYLRGSSLVEIPQVLLPRAIWPEKPLGVDVLSGRYLYPGTGVANPISLQGELYWNGGVWTVALGAFVLGLVFGGLGRLGHVVGPATPGRLVLYAVAVPFTFAFLTRGLAIMTASLTLALLGTSLAVAAVSPTARDAVARRLSGRYGRTARQPV